jgi:mRNA interferase MazF
VRRGEVVIVAPQGNYGKPRPALIVQSDALDAADSVLVVLFTSTLTEAPLYRLTVEPSGINGLKALSQLMVDKILAYPRAKCSPAIGRLEPNHLLALNAMLSVMIGLGD